MKGIIREAWWKEVWFLKIIFQTNKKKKLWMQKTVNICSLSKLPIQYISYKDVTTDSKQYLQWDNLANTKLIIHNGPTINWNQIWPITMWGFFPISFLACRSLQCLAQSTSESGHFCLMRKWWFGDGWKHMEQTTEEAP